MSEQQSNPLPQTGWHLKKPDDDATFGPVDQETLIDWAKSAQISPRDFLSTDAENWIPAYEVAFLNMVWVVSLPDSNDSTYGPTTTGALREFLSRGLVNHNSPVTHCSTHQHLPLGALLASEEMEQKRTNHPGDAGRTGMIMLDMAKEQRIRQLTEDLRELRVEHENLKQKFRQLQMQSEKR